MKRISKSKLYSTVYHAVFGLGIVAQQRLSDGSRSVSDCVFGDGTSPRTILSSCLLVFAEQRTATLSERHAIKRLLLDLEPTESRVPRDTSEVKDSACPELDNVQTTNNDLELIEDLYVAESA
jgi:hypothetical protein